MEVAADAERLAEALVRLGRQAGREVVALVADMNQPLGSAVGNALEVREAIDTLHDAGPRGLRQHCLTIATEVLCLSRRVETRRDGLHLARDTLSSGAAWERFRQMVEAQGGDVSCVDNPDGLPQAAIVEVVPAPRSGYLAGLDAAEVGLAVVGLGGGREEMGQPIDHSVGVLVHHKVGDAVREGAPLFTVHANDREKLDAASERVLRAHSFSNESVQPLPLFYQRIPEQ